MTRNICENCIWGDKCHTTDAKCEYINAFDDNHEEAELREDRLKYEYEWQTYLAHWNGNDKWGDTYDK